MRPAIRGKHGKMRENIETLPEEEPNTRKGLDRMFLSVIGGDGHG